MVGDYKIVGAQVSNNVGFIAFIAEPPSSTDLPVFLWIVDYKYGRNFEVLDNLINTLYVEHIVKYGNYIQKKN